MLIENTLCENILITCSNSVRYKTWVLKSCKSKREFGAIESLIYWLSSSN